MSVATSPSLTSLADLINDLAVAPERIRLQSPPGTASEQNVIALREGIIYCEVLDGVQVALVYLGNAFDFSVCH